MFKVYDKVRFISNPWKFNVDVTNGKVYVIHRVDEEGDAFFEDDSGGTSYISYKNRHLFELVTEPSKGKPVETSQDVIELLANLSRRLYEAEKEIAELNEKQALFFDIDKLLSNRIIELERHNNEQAYEINELYKAVADRG